MKINRKRQESEKKRAKMEGKILTSQQNIDKIEERIINNKK